MLGDKIVASVLGTAMSAITAFAGLLFFDNRAQDKELAEVKAEQAVTAERYKTLHDDIKDIRETQLRQEAKIEDILRSAGDR